MINQLIFIPVLLQMLILIALFIRLARAKKVAIANDEVDQQRRALHSDAWPSNVIQITNSVNNQFQTPLLFYVLILMLWQLDGINVVTHVLAWTFTLSRIIHAYIHVTHNEVPKRLLAFKIGIVTLLSLIILTLWFCIAPILMG